MAEIPFTDSTFHSAAGAVRQAFGFPSPAYAGAAIALLVIALWCGSLWAGGRPRASVIRIGLLAVELGLWLMLAMTMARAPMFGLGMAATVLLIYRARLSLPRAFDQTPAAFAGRAAVFAVMIFAVGADQRLSPGQLASDASVVHRLDYWLAGLRSYSNSSWLGAGEGAARTCWAQWFGPLDSTRTPLGFSNAFLELGFDHGALALAAILAAIAYFVLQPLRREERSATWRAVSIAGALGVLVIASCHFFSTLAWSPGLLVLEAVFVLGAAGYALRRGGGRRLALASIGLGLTIAIGTKLTGRLLQDSAEQAVFFEHDGTVAFGRGPGAGQKLEIVGDPHVLPSAGKLVRALRRTLAHAPTFRLHPAGNPQFTAGGVTIAAGEAWKQLAPSMKERPAVLLYPIGFPARLDAAPNTVLVLPEIDETGFSAQWLAWAASHNVKSYTVADCGLDAGGNPEGLGQILNQVLALP